LYHDISEALSVLDFEPIHDYYGCMWVTKEKILGGLRNGLQGEGSKVIQ
jgi:hypothetical protein